MLQTPFSRFSEYFMAVARLGSLRKAADQLFISVSAVHRQIVLAEEELGIALFERLPNGLKLTLAGELLYADLLKWQKDFQQTQIRFDEIRGLNRGHVEFGLISALSDGFVLNSVKTMYQEYPWINFNIRVADSDAIAQKIMQSELDFGLILNPQSHQHLEVIEFVELPMGFVLSKQHRFAAKSKLYFSDLLDDHHLLAAEPLMIHDYVQALYKYHQFNPAKRTVSNDIRMMNNLIQQNLAIGILSYLDVLSLLNTDQLVFKRIQDHAVRPLTLALCVAPKRQLSKAAQVMMKMLMTEMQTIQQQLQQL